MQTLHLLRSHSNRARDTQASLAIPPGVSPARSLLRHLLVPTCPQGAVGLLVSTLCPCLAGVALSTVGPIRTPLQEFGIRREAVSWGPSSWVPAHNMHPQKYTPSGMLGPCMSYVCPMYVPCTMWNHVCLSYAAKGWGPERQGRKRDLRTQHHLTSRPLTPLYFLLLVPFSLRLAVGNSVTQPCLSFFFPSSSSLSV